MTQPKDEHAATPARQPTLSQPTLNWRFEFATYGATRNFLDLLADLSKRDDYYPNINFGKTYVNVSIDGEGQAELRERSSSFIDDMHALFTPAGV